MKRTILLLALLAGCGSRDGWITDGKRREASCRRFSNKPQISSHLVVCGKFHTFIAAIMAGLYVHIPFCGSRCAYCDFYSRVCPAGTVSDFPDALGWEMSFRRGFFGNGQGGWGGRLDTIYIGGGTPSLLSPEQLQGIMDRAAELWDCSALKETTLEANPEDLTGGYLARLAATGFGRLSIGVQSFDDGLLRTMNRRHSAARAREAVRTAQKEGFANISIDLIFGIPEMSHAQWERTLDEAVALGVQHISAYHLTVEPGTAFGKMAREGKLAPVPEAESEQQYKTLRHRLAEAGFEHYEISNFARPGRHAVHNSAYWSGLPYLGVGAGAHSYDGGRRRERVVANIGKYMAGAGTDTVYEAETLSDTDLYNERIMTGLRRAEGVPAEWLEQPVQKFLAEGLLLHRDGRIAIPPEKFLLSDYIIGALFKV